MMDSPTAIPTQLGDHYRMIRVLGSGGMGTVYLAFDPRLERHVAIKRLHVAADDPQQRARLREESKLLAKINHPSIVQIYDVIERDRELMLVIEYVDGGNLADWLVERHVDIDRVLELAIHIAEGLHAAHSVGVIHRDLKCENVLIDRHGAIKIVDFGIAKSLLNHTAPHTVEGTVVGSLEAMAPEQLLGQALDHRCDLFALGLLLFRLLSGAPAFARDDSEGSQFERILYAQADFHRCPENTPAPLIALLRQLLEKSAERRPANAAVVLEALRRMLDEQRALPSTRILSEATSASRVVPARLARLSRQHWGLRAVVLLALGLVSFYAATFYAASWRASQPPRYIAVPAPEMLDYASPYDASLVNDAVHRGIRDGVLSLRGAALVAGDGLNALEEAGSDIERARAAGAQELIRSRLRCQKSLCELFLARVRVIDAVLLMQAQFNVPIASLMQLHQLATGHTQGLVDDLPVMAARGDLRISAEGYQQYLELNRALKPGVVNTAAIHALLVLQDQWPNFLPAYDLITAYYLDLYTESRDQQYLHEAERVLDKGLALQAGAPSLQFNRLRVALKKPHDATVLEDLEYLETQGFDASDIAALRAEYWKKQGEFSRAVEALDGALALRRSVPLLYRKAVLQWMMGAMTEVSATLDELLALAPDYLPAIGLRADSALMAGDAELAITQYSRLLTLQDSSLNHNNLGLAYYLKGDFQRARQSFQTAVSATPDKATWLLNLADSEWLSGEHEVARRHYSEVLALLEHEPAQGGQFFAGKAQALMHLGAEEEAVINIQQALRMSPDSIETRYIAALIFTLLGEPISASVHRKHALAGGLSERWFQLPWFAGSEVESSPPQLGQQSRGE